MSVLLQVSDPHFGTQVDEVVEALVAFAKDKRPDVLMLSGDITQRARREQFLAARAFCDRLGIGVELAVPGNHDIALFDVFTRVVAPYRHYRESFGNDLEPVLDTPDLLVIGVNCTRPWRHKHGEISKAQIRRISDRLARAGTGQLRVVVTHQPVDVPTGSDENNLVRGHADAVHAWVEAGADILMGGHIHLPFIRPLAQRYPELRRAAWCVQGGTAVSHRVRADRPNSVNLVTHVANSGQAVVERWDFAGEGGFECGERVELVLDRSTNHGSDRTRQGAYRESHS
ncbi:metallophosphoesterase family protein [Alkalisalibacterium limincola]|uniref:Metallophosphoesterase n=1 Tax=Alkalisalibacterium limincola TaxID=2699169 RepID=A0A5C8KWX0_9GAMM|nr:metallophosphoesterase [Alkalisalibacterium limincola]TXK64314.1 metallophosphoesterase [Alkalisalibacterium limincola]